MATSAFTVSDAIRRVNRKLRGRAGAVSKLDKIEAIDDAHQALWRTLLMSYRGWFVVESQKIESGDPDFFPDIVDTATEYDLPTELHQIYYIESTIAGRQDYKFHPTTMPDDEFRKRRQSVVTVTSNEKSYWYDVVGDNPPRLVLGQSIPPSVSPLVVKIWYVKRLDKLTAEADILTAAPVPFFGPMCALAAAQIASDIEAFDLCAKLKAEWEEARFEVVALAQRTIAEPLATPHLDAEGRPMPAGQQGAL